MIDSNSMKDEYLMILDNNSNIIYILCVTKKNTW